MARRLVAARLKSEDVLGWLKTLRASALDSDDLKLGLVVQARLLRDVPLDQAEWRNLAEIASRVDGVDLARKALIRSCTLVPADGSAWLTLAALAVSDAAPDGIRRMLARVAAAWGGPATLDERHLAQVNRIASVACRQPVNAGALRILLGLWDVGLNSRRWLCSAVASAIRAMPAAQVDGERRDLLVALASRAATNDVRNAVLAMMIEGDRSTAGLDILHDAGVHRHVVLTSLIHAKSRLRRPIERSEIFHPDPVPGLGRQFHVLAPPKSASMFVANVVSEMFGYPVVNLSQHEVSGHDIETGFFLSMLSKDVVVHQHSKASPKTIALLSTFDIVPLVPIRNVFDTLVSIRDSRVARNYPVDRHFVNLSQEDQLYSVFLERFEELLKFFLSWNIAVMNRKVRAAIVSSRTMVLNPSEVIAGFVAANGVTVDPALLSATLRRIESSGRASNVNPKRRERLPFDIGYELFPNEIIAIARRAYKNYPGVDFRLFDHRYGTGTK